MALIEFSTAGLPGYGDTDAGGGGLDTSSRTNETDLEVYGQDWDNGYGDGGTIVTPNAVGGPTDEPVAWWIALVVIFVIVSYYFRKDEEHKHGIVTDIICHTLEVLIGLTFLKMVFGVWKIPGASQLVEAA